MLKRGEVLGVVGGIGLRENQVLLRSIIGLIKPGRRARSAS